MMQRLGAVEDLARQERGWKLFLLSHVAAQATRRGTSKQREVDRPIHVQSWRVVAVVGGQQSMRRERSDSPQSATLETSR